MTVGTPVRADWIPAAVPAVPPPTTSTPVLKARWAFEGCHARQQDANMIDIAVILIDL
jgi:hypothetical protein